jgi:alkyl sulfatase BDS1-like metallo-beta-lactamase superfamily hydrolase
VYPQGVFELRHGAPQADGINPVSPDAIRAMPPEMLLDYLSVHLNDPKAAGKQIGLSLNFTDLKKEYGPDIENAVRS